MTTKWGHIHRHLRTNNYNLHPHPKTHIHHNPITLIGKTHPINTTTATAIAITDPHNPHKLELTITTPHTKITLLDPTPQRILDAAHLAGIIPPKL